MSGSDSDFWRFSLRFYRRPEVQNACLKLQDHLDVDVNVLFFVLFLATHGRRLSPAEVQRMNEHVRDWRACVVQPLRAVRRILKQQGITPLDTSASAALRSAVKGAELDAERLQQQALELAFPVISTGLPDAPKRAAAANIAAYGAWPAEYVTTLLGALACEFSL